MIVLPGRSSSWGGFAHTDDTSLASLYVAGDWSTAAGNITQWNDSSGNARHLTADLGPTSRPTDNTTYATFNGTSHILKCTDHMFDANGATCFMVLANFPDNPFQMLLGEFGSSARYGLYRTPGSSYEHRIQIWNDTPTDVGTSDVTTNDPAFTTPAQIIEFVDTGSNLSTFFDGSTQHNMSYTRSGTFTFAQFCLGAQYTTFLGEKGAGDIYRLLVTHTTDSATRDNHRNLLASDYGITL